MERHGLALTLYSMFEARNWGDGFLKGPCSIVGDFQCEVPHGSLEYGAHENIQREYRVTPSQLY